MTNNALRHAAEKITHRMFSVGLFKVPMDLFLRMLVHRKEDET